MRQKSNKRFCLSFAHLPDNYRCSHFNNSSRELKNKKNLMDIFYRYVSATFPYVSIACCIFKKILHHDNGKGQCRIMSMTCELLPMNDDGDNFSYFFLSFVCFVEVHDTSRRKMKFGSFTLRGKNQ